MKKKANKQELFSLTYDGQPMTQPDASVLAGVNLHCSAFAGGGRHGGGWHNGFSTHASQHWLMPSAFFNTRPFDASQVNTTARHAVFEQSTGQS